MFLDSDSVRILSHLRLAHHTDLCYVVFAWRCALCLVRYCLHAVCLVCRDILTRYSFRILVMTPTTLREILLNSL
jgi:hypothetical protein